MNQDAMFSGALIGLTAVGLSGDAFAASLARGAGSRSGNLARALRNGAIFGTAEGAMCLLGWLLAAGLSGLVTALDHWVAVILLGFIGGKMIVESFAEGPAETGRAAGESRLAMTCLTALATSVDSAVIGVAMNFSGVEAGVALLIGGVSAVLSTLGFLLGPIAGQLLGRRAELVGGLVLIAIGVSIWTDHVLA
ncbi:manganese efflux pump MntP family protein [Wenzhouxiangella sediminis]|nr:manganese efflux pump [Wenzhouxiangella sediminis]MEE4303149.1 manganese efflux pump [Wenzhouxiangella sp.]